LLAIAVGQSSGCDYLTAIASKLAPTGRGNC
jgi:hypothetical protein